MKRCFGERWRHTSSVAMLRGRQLTGNSLLLMLVLSCIVFIHRDHRDELLAMSFAGEDRHYVESVVKCLKRRGLNVFYDRHYEIDLWGKKLREKLDHIYRLQSEYVIIFISKYYARKDWTIYELNSALSRSVREKREYVLPARLDNTKLNGLPEDIVYIDINNNPPSRFARKIVRKLATNKQNGRNAKGLFRRKRVGSSVITRPKSFFSFAGLRYGEGMQRVKEIYGIAQRRIKKYQRRYHILYYFDGGLEIWCRRW